MFQKIGFWGFSPLDGGGLEFVVWPRYYITVPNSVALVTTAGAWLLPV